MACPDTKTGSSPSTTRHTCGLLGVSRDSCVPCGNSSAASKAQSTTSSTSSSIESSLSEKPSAAWEAIPTWNDDEEHTTRRSSTVPSLTHVSRAPGGSVNLDSKVVELDRISQQPGARYSAELHSSLSRKWIPRATSGTPEDFDRSNSSSSHHRGETSARSTSRVRPTLGSRRSSGKPTATPTYTVWQAMHLFGTTATKHRLFSSLTTLRSQLAAKNSSATWMDILSNFQSREALSGLDSTLCATAPTTMSGRRSRRTREEDSLQEAISGSDDDEESTKTSSSSCEEDNRLEEAMTPPPIDLGSSDESQEWSHSGKRFKRSYACRDDCNESP